MKEKDILTNISNKLGIKELNTLQKNVLKISSTTKGDVIIYAPTGSGKTIAFSIPVLKSTDAIANKLQAVIIAPSRELVIQIESVIKLMSDNLHICACYGGHNVLDEKNSLSNIPHIIVSTPGRLLDHVNRKNITITNTKILVLDEFDKSLELGFHEEMEKLIKSMPNISRKILTSATKIKEFPNFIKLKSTETVNHLWANEELSSRLTITKVVSPEKDKLETLFYTLNNISDNTPCIVFVNHRDAAARVYNYLKDNKLPVGIYHGGMDQIEREKAIELFENHSFKILISTDLGARGLDISEVGHIIHYHLPLSKETYTHRNGRSARINSTGKIYVILHNEEPIPDYIEFDDTLDLEPSKTIKFKAECSTLYFNAGKKEKISKGDIVGFLINKGLLENGEIGIINSHDHYSLAAIPRKKVTQVLKNLSGQKIKNQKVKISLAEQRIVLN